MSSVNFLQKVLRLKKKEKRGDKQTNKRDEKRKKKEKKRNERREKRKKKQKRKNILFSSGLYLFKIFIDSRKMSINL